MLVSDRSQKKLLDELVGPISSFKKTAIQFAETLNSDCPVIHIRGTSHLFSVYDVDKHLLCFYTQMPGTVLEKFDVPSADGKMEPLIQELRLLLHNLDT
jgi:hypothetical protein